MEEAYAQDGNVVLIKDYQGIFKIYTCSCPTYLASMEAEGTMLRQAKCPHVVAVMLKRHGTTFDEYKRQEAERLRIIDANRQQEAESADGAP
jgi:predicted nucleic acid-binding Zn finger protein